MSKGTMHRAMGILPKLVWVMARDADAHIKAETTHSTLVTSGYPRLAMHLVNV